MVRPGPRVQEGWVELCVVSVHHEPGAGGHTLRDGDGGDGGGDTLRDTLRDGDGGGSTQSTFPPAPVAGVSTVNKSEPAPMIDLKLASARKSLMDNLKVNKINFESNYIIGKAHFEKEN